MQDERANMSQLASQGFSFAGPDAESWGVWADPRPSNQKAKSAATASTPACSESLPKTRHANVQRQSWR